MQVKDRAWAISVLRRKGFQIADGDEPDRIYLAGFPAVVYIKLEGNGKGSLWINGKPHKILPSELNFNN